MVQLKKTKIHQDGLQMTCGCDTRSEGRTGLGLSRVFSFLETRRLALSVLAITRANRLGKTVAAQLPIPTLFVDI